MFGFFKKSKPEPSSARSREQEFQRFFATEWVRTALTSSVAGFSGAMLCGDGGKLIANAWSKMWTSNFPNVPMISADGLELTRFMEDGHLIVCVTFPFAGAVGTVHFGTVVLGPCKDPEWGPDARHDLPFRYFVLCHAADGTSVEEWTGDPATRVGAGPQPDLMLFVEWVLNHAVRDAAEATVTVPRQDDAVAAAIERARQELPAVLQRFIAGELRDASFTVKVRVADQGGAEHFWLSDTAYSDGRFSGIIDADPQAVSTVQRGDRWTASMEDVSDWMYTRNGKMFGNHTLRALLPNLPPQDAAKYRAILAGDKDAG